MKTTRRIIVVSLVLIFLMCSSCMAVVKGLVTPTKAPTSSKHQQARSQATALISESMGAYEMVNAYNRTATAAMMVVDYCMLFNGDSQEISFGRDAYICARSNVAVDIYIPMIDGDYENLYFVTSTEQITDYGRKPESEFTKSTQNTFYQVDGQKIFEFLEEMSDYM